MTSGNLTRWQWYTDAAGCVFCIGVTLVFYVLGISPLQRKHTDQASRYASLSAQQGIATKLAEELEEAKSSLVEANKTLDESPFQLVSSSSVNSRIARMTELASKCGLKLDQIRPGTPAVGSRYETIPIYLTGSGNYHTCVLLLYRLRQAFPDTTVTSLELSRDEGAIQAGASFSISLLWYTSPALSAAR